MHDDVENVRYPKLAAQISGPVSAGQIKVSDIARELGVSTNAVRKYMAGETLPGPENLMTLARILNVPVAQLLPDLDDHAKRKSSAVKWRDAGLLGLLADLPPGNEHLFKFLDVSGENKGNATAAGIAGLLSTHLKNKAPARGLLSDAPLDPLALRRAAIRADLDEMLGRYTNGDDLRSAYMRVLQVLDSHWSEVRERNVAPG